MTAAAVSEPGAPRPVTPVGILAARLADLTGRVGAIEGVDPALVADLASARDLAAGLDPYVEAHTSPASAGLAELARRTAAHDWRTGGERFLEQEMLSGHVEGRFLAMLVKVAGARRVLDVGMFTGYSALAMAEALPDGGSVVACEVDADVAAFARYCFADVEHGARIDVRVGLAADTLAGLAAAGETFDLVFVDADKVGYAGYLAAVLGDDDAPGLLAPGGLVCVDNTLMQGLPWSAGDRGTNGDAVARFNETVSADARVEQVVVPLRDGVTLVRRRDTP